MGKASREEIGLEPRARREPGESGEHGAPDVSVIVVAYNTRELTRRCLESVLGAYGVRGAGA